MPTPQDYLDQGQIQVQAATDAATVSNLAAGVSVGARNATTVKAAEATTAANNANTYRDGAQNFYNLALIQASGNSSQYATKAAANTALAGLAANAFAFVWADESREGRTTVYQKVSGAYTFVNNVELSSTREFYVRPEAGSDSNPGTRDAPFATMIHALTLATAGTTIWTWPGSIIKENFPYANNGLVKDGINIRTLGGGKTIWSGFDKFNGPWTANGSAYYNTNPIVHAFGGASGYDGSGRIYPNMIYRQGVNGKWKQVYTRYGNEFANNAAGIAWVQANPYSMFVEDLSHASNYATGWWQGNFRYHINLNGVNPSTCQFMVLQRFPPFFGRYHLIENQHFFGSHEHDGLIIRSSHLENVELSYMIGQHACEITGVTSNNLVVRNGRLVGAGYALHQFSPGGANWPVQKVARHTNTKIYNWPGAIVGCHGTDEVDGGGGPGVEEALLILDDFYGENINNIGNGGPLTSGIVFNNPVFNVVGSLTGSGWNLTFNNMRTIQGRPTNDIGPTGDQPLFQPSASGFTCTINGGTSITTTFKNPIQGSGDGSLVINNHRSIHHGLGFGAELIYDVAPYTNITINDSIFQFEGGPERHGQVVPAIAYPNAAWPKNFNRSHFGGYGELMRTQDGVTCDEHTVIGGNAGLERTGEVHAPIRTLPTSSWYTLGNRVLSFGWGFGGNRFYGIVTSTGVWMTVTITGGSTVADFQYPSGFVARGGFGMWPTSNNTYVYGKTGGLLYNPAYAYSPPTTMTAITTGTTKEFTGHLVNGPIAFLGCSDGSIYKLDTATNAVTAVTSPVNWKIRGGVAVDTNNLILYGYNDADETGGLIYSTNAGATWAVNTSVGGVGISCAAAGNGAILIMRRGVIAMTGTTVNGTFDLQYDMGVPEIDSVIYDPTTKNMICAGSARLFGGTNYGLGKRSGRWTTVGTIDTNPANRATWRYRGRTRPLPSVNWLCQTNAQSYDGTVFNEILFLGQSLAVASVQDIDSTDFAYDIVRPPATVSHDTRIEDNFGYLIS